MRSLTSGINTALTTQGSYPGWLIEITVPFGAQLLYCTFDTDFGLYVSADIDMPSMTWDGSVLRPAKIVFGDPDGLLWSCSMQGLFTDAGVRLWQTYAAATGESEPVWSGRIGQISRTGAVSGSPTVSFDLSDGSDVNSAPRTRIQESVDPQYLLAAGTVLTFDGVNVVLGRPTSAAG